jgi:glycosyltransferase involved in cell wall biosynthesis
MSVYSKDIPEQLEEALESILVHQTVLPDQVVLVIDGPIPDALSGVLSDWENRFCQLILVTCIENIGLSNAMNVGLNECEYDVVFRMDADDVSVHNRFEKQLMVFSQNPSVSMVGGFYKQFDSKMEMEVGDRVLPLSFDELKSYGLRRTPINHVTIAFRKKDALEVGGYPDTRLPFEDWWLALRFLQLNKEIVNIPEFLVNVRSGDSFYSRRSGFSYLKQEVSAMYYMTAEGVMPYYYAITNIIIRAPVRLIPAGLIGFVYEKILRKN